MGFKDMTFDLVWQRAVLKAEGLSDWKIIEAADPYCWREEKTIQLPVNAQPGLFLHEVAHALYQEPEGPMQNHYHGGRWAQTYGDLINHYMVPVHVDRIRGGTVFKRM